CPSGSGGGGWTPLVTRGWPPTSSLTPSAFAVTADCWEAVPGPSMNRPGVGIRSCPAFLAQHLIRWWWPGSHGGAPAEGAVSATPVFTREAGSLHELSSAG